MDEKTEKKRILRPKEKLINVLKEVDINSLKLDLPEEVKEITTLIYKDAEDKHLIRGKSIKLVVTASFYIACRQCNAPRTLS
ncbi:MAG: hypothetical protein LBV42_04040 [Methanobrevibacter sp.]|jgi:transcription initiation factor TFIIB|nr:hypothetical protein [Methanobrevibacter sp.]